MTNAPHDYGSNPPPELLPDVPRRGFLASALAIVIGGILALVPLVTGTLFFLDPLLRRKPKSDAGDEGEGFVKLGISLEELKQSPVPVRVPVVSSKIDKWTRYPDRPVGAVYVHWQEDEVLAFNVKCPHLGCEVEYRTTPDEQQDPEYYCPCHTSAFQLDGEKKNSVPPRSLDSLEVKVVKSDQDAGEIWVKYQEFRATLEEKVPV